MCRTAKCTYRHPARARVTSIAVPVRCAAGGDDRYNTRAANGRDTITANDSCCQCALFVGHPGICRERDSRAGYATVLDEIHDTGYAGTELGDWGFMPTDPRAACQRARGAQLQLVGAFVPVALADESAHDAGLATAVRTAR